MTDSENITRLLRRVDEGRDGALDELMRTVYEDLEGIARKHLRERFGHGLAGVTLEPAALVNESFLKLIRQRSKFDNRGHFFAIATKVMLRVLVDYQRSRRAEKRGGDRERVALPLDGPAAAAATAATADERLIDVDLLVEALAGLETEDARKADVVKLRVVWGLSMHEIAQSLDVSLATVERDWAFSKAWLARKAATARDEGQPGADPRVPPEASPPDAAETGP